MNNCKVSTASVNAHKQVQDTASALQVMVIYNIMAVTLNAASPNSETEEDMRQRKDYVNGKINSVVE
jgi:hypothetical protein